MSKEFNNKNVSNRVKEVLSLLGSYTKPQDS